MARFYSDEEINGPKVSSQTPSPEDLERSLNEPSVLAQGVASGKLRFTIQEVENGWLLVAETRAGLLSVRKEYVATTGRGLIELVKKVLEDMSRRGV